jgi:hypothetical protein
LETQLLETRLLEAHTLIAGNTDPIHAVAEHMRSVISEITKVHSGHCGTWMVRVFN